MRSKAGYATLCGLAGICLVAANATQAADLASPAPAPAPPVIASFWDTIKFSGQIDAGITGNANDPGSKRNFGHLFTDHANIPLLNQILLTVQRPLDPKATGYDFGFKVQGLYGSDARYTHFLGELDRVIGDRNQVDIVEAWGIVHLPLLTSGGIDVKVGQYVTLEGAETIDPSTNLFYSHSYIFNFGIPFKHTGVMTITHVNPLVDVYVGVDTGVNTTFVRGTGDNNNAGGFHGGIGLNLLDGNLTVLATTHIGPENPINPPFTAPIPGGSNALRYLNDITTTWKLTDKLTLINDLNYIRDDGFNADGYGVAQYVSYQLTDIVKINARGEVWRDADNFFVAQFPGNRDFVNAELGRPTTGLITTGRPFGGSTTYGAITLGLNITPAVPKPLASLTFRPEVRYDSALNSSRPYNAARAGGRGLTSDQFTFGGDIVLSF